MQRDGQLRHRLNDDGGRGIFIGHREKKRRAAADDSLHAHAEAVVGELAGVYEIKLNTASES